MLGVSSANLDESDMFAEWLISCFSREIAQDGSDRPEYSLALLEREYPDFAQLVTGKTVLDFGCGLGIQSSLLATQYRCNVTGFDTNQKTIESAREQHGKFARFVTILPDVDDDPRRFSIIISQNAMEHYGDPALALAQMAAHVAEDGRVLITFGPPWHSPYGSHMHFFCRIPWLNVLFPERAVMAVRSRYKHDGARHYEDVESGLNRMTLRKFETLIKASGLRIERKYYSGVKRCHFLTKLPYLREFCTVHVTVILKPTPGRPVETP